MRFWDSSAIVPILTREATSDRLRARLVEDSGPLVWWGTVVECQTAIARLHRHAAIDATGRRVALDRLRELATGWIEVPASEQVRDQAMRIVRLHPLRASDAFQLAAALIGAELKSRNLEFVTLDRRLAEAADREGFRVLD